MQFYPTPAVPPQVRPEYAYPAAPIATSPRMNWSPAMHQGPWGAYEFSYPGYPGDSHRIQASLAGEHPNATPHNIRDILGAHPGAVPSEVAKMPSNYQRSPTSTTAGEQFVRSPTTPTSANMYPIPGKPFEGVVYSEVPGCFYGVPAIPRLQVGYDPNAGEKIFEGALQHPPGLIYAPGHPPPTSPDAVKSPTESDKQSGKDGKKEKKGRATFSGAQIDELEKAFTATQYLTTAERSRLADRLGLAESQVKIWFQNRRTKCRRTSWKSKGQK